MLHVHAVSSTDPSATTRDLAANCPAGLTPELLALQEGVYLVGSGSSGVAATFLTLGALYTSVIMLSAFSLRVPAPGWSPNATANANHQVVPQTADEPDADPVEGDVHIDDAIKTPQV